MSPLEELMEARMEAWSWIRIGVACVLDTILGTFANRPTRMMIDERVLKLSIDQPCYEEVEKQLSSVLVDELNY